MSVAELRRLLHGIETTDGRNIVEVAPDQVLVTATSGP
jgi:hypothetical protein